MKTPIIAGVPPAVYQMMNQIMNKGIGEDNLDKKVTELLHHQFKNHIINGDFDIWQRGMSFSTVGYTADRWQLHYEGSSATVSQQTFVLGQTSVPGEPTYFLRTSVTSVSGAANRCLLTQRIESVRTLAGQTATLSFWVKADGNKPIAVEFIQVFGTGGTPSSSVYTYGAKLNLTTLWQRYTVTVNLPSIVGKTLGTNNNDYLSVIFWFDAGSNYDSRTNSLGQQSGVFDIWGVQLEKGSVATDFEWLPFQQKRALCERFYEVYESGIGSGTGILPLVQVSTNNLYSWVQFSSPKRATPTIIWRDLAINPGVLSPTFEANKYFWGIRASSTATTGYLYATTSTSLLAFDAEL